MSHATSPYALRARYVFPVAGPPISGGVITIRDRRIVSVSASAGDVLPRDLGNVAILPGLVNAHTHLEFSSLTERLGTYGIPLPDWIPLVIQYRQARTESIESAVECGLAESKAAGVVALGEIATSDWRSAVSLPADLCVTAFVESMAPTYARIAAAVAASESFSVQPSRSPALRPGFSPHAPYTVHVELLARIVALAQKHRLPVAMHLSEAREELELLHTGSGKFRDFLGRIGAWDPDPAARHRTILGYLQQLAVAPRSLAIHGNYLTADEIDFLARHSGTMTVVYCARTHVFFRHETYPLAEMLARGVAMALGTDSRASNPDLNFLAEMRHVAAHHPQVSPAKVLELGTLAGANALGLENDFGTLQAGKRGSVAIVELPSHDAVDPHELLFT